MASQGSTDLPVCAVVWNIKRGNCVRKVFGALLLAAVAGCAFCAPVVAEEDADVSEGVSAKVVTTDDGHFTQEGSRFEDGKWVLPEDDTPTFSIKKKDGFKVDWYTYNGYRRYHDACHVCHGPDGEGSTYAPRLATSLKTMSYDDFVATVSGGREVNRPGIGESVMPSFGDNKNVMCYIDDLYTYLKARSLDVLPRGKLTGRMREKKPQEARDYDKECFGE